MRIDGKVAAGRRELVNAHTSNRDDRGSAAI